MKKFSPQKLQSLRHQKKFSLNELSRQIYAKQGFRISGQTIYNWERGVHSPQIEHLMQLAAFFKKPLEYFFAHKPDNMVKSNGRMQS